MFGLIPAGVAIAGAAVDCEDPTDPQNPHADAETIPGSPGGDPQAPVTETGEGVIKPNDGSGSAAEDKAAKAAREAQGGTASATPRTVNSTECDWMPLEPSPGAGDPRWEGADPTTNTIIFNNCNGPTRYGVVPNGSAPAAPPPPDPAVLAQQAIGQLRIPHPGIHLGPDPDKIAVNFYTWLWIDGSPPVSSTVALAGVSVTATATLSSVDWSMGEPLSLAGGGIGSVTCQGAGVAPSADSDFNEPPPCGYMFNYRSLLERTNGVGKWPVSATATWAVTWAASTGESGADSLSASSTTNVEVGEYRTTRGTGG